MILITVSGQTIGIRKALNNKDFQWNRLNRQWSKLVSHNQVIGTLKPIWPQNHYGHSKPIITVRLYQVDSVGNPLSPAVIVSRKDVDRVADVFENKGISGVIVSPQLIAAPANPMIDDWEVK